MRLLALLFAGAAVAAGPESDFAARLAAYQKVHAAAAAKVGRLKPTAAPERIARHERELGHRIREAREHAAQGNMFTPEIAAMFRRLLGEAMNGPEGGAIRQSLARGEPVKLPPLRVDHPYPEGSPLQTSPPSLLANLPQLPSGYEYRVAGNGLLLLDREANLVIDYLPNAIP